MSGEEHIQLDEHQRRAQRSVRELSRPEARPEFVRNLRASFVSRPAVGVRANKRWAPRAWQLVAAAALLLLFVLNRPPSWELLGAEGIEQVLVDGRPVPLDELAKELRPGRVLQLPGPGTLDLVSGNTLFFQLVDEIELTLPRSPARWMGREVGTEVAGNGRLRVMTGEAFEGARLAMRTEFVEWEVTGTCFTVIAHGDLLCLCVLEGEVQACPMGDELQPIPSGGRATFTAGGKSVDRGVMREDERVALTELSARANQLFTP